MSTFNDLKRIEAFANLSQAGETLLQQGLVGDRVSARHAVLHQGEPVSGAIVILGGRLRVFTMGPNGNEATLYFVNPGETCVLALNCLFNDHLYPAWVEADLPTRFARIAGPVYRRLFDIEPGVREMTVRSLSTLVYRLMEELDEIHSRPLAQRLAQFVLRHANSQGILHTTQLGLARHLGTTREGIARVLGSPSVRKLFATRRGCIAIKDLFGVRRLLSGPRS
ncbi:MAG TPA: Crp/Fnr family transcriptional regulator [Steroidobacteraceae bacterium]|nr:Crp/Fnr family transcriptional regulator [Steroidobacteraceae bacterium]